MADPLEKKMEYRLEKRGVHVLDGVVQSLAAVARRVIGDEISAARRQIQGEGPCDELFIRGHGYAERTARDGHHD